MSANPSPAVAALLSLIFPGLGQIYAGQIRKGLLWAIPMVLLVIAAIWLLLGGQSRIESIVTIGKNQVALLVFNFAFFCYHVAAMVDAYAIAQRERSRSFGYRSAAPVALAALVAVAILIHGLPEVYGVDIHNAYVAVVPPGGRPDVLQSFHAETPNPNYTPPPEASPTDSVPPPTSPGTSPTPPGTPTGSTSPGTPVPTRSPLPSFDPTNWPAWAQDGRLNVLLVGSDSRSDTGVGAVSLRTDSMIMLSVDIQSGKAALFSFPRNLCTATNGSCGDGTRYPDWLQIKLPAEDTDPTTNPAGAAAFPDGTFAGPTSMDGLLTSLWRVAAAHPEIFPGAPDESSSQCQQDFTCERAWRALVGALQIFTGQQIDGVIAVNLNGFVGLVSSLQAQCPNPSQRVALPDTPACYGGLWLQTDPLQDDGYSDSQRQNIPVDFQAGCFYTDAEYSLAYARSRHQDSDYQRERRQQYVLQQIRKQLDPLGLLPKIPTLLQVAAQNLFTTFGDTDIQYLAQVAVRVDADRLYRQDFAPGHVGQLGSMQGIQDSVTNIFGQPEPQPQPTPSNPAQACPPRT